MSRALAMLNLIKNDVFSEQLKCLLPRYISLIFLCSVINLVRMIVFATVGTRYAVTGELKKVGYVNYISEALKKLK